MSSANHKLRLIGAVATLAILATGVACKGFFVNPTVTAITIDPPNPTLSIGGAPVQLTAAGTDSNGNPLTLTAGTSCTGTTVCWSNSDPTIATLSAGGLLTAVSAGTSTITAASGTATATTTATVTLANVTSIVLGPAGVTSFDLPENSIATGSQCLTALATAGGQQVDVTDSVTWQTGTPGILTVENAVDPMCVQSSSTPGPTTVYAQYVSGTNTITSNSVTVTVTP
jgi:uncharacterized protein YjdB